MSENKIKFPFIEKIKGNKKLQKIIVCILIVIVFLILIFTFFNNDNSDNQTIEQNNYSDILESRLSNTLSKVDGVGEVSVVITVESGMETVLAMKTTTTQTANGVEIEETPILVNGKTVVLKESYPKITGVLIVAEGAKNISVLTKIQQATVSLLDINLNQIEILTMK